MSKRVYTEEDFEELSWHDCALYGFHIDTDRQTYSDLVLDIDFIVEWLCGTSPWPKFRVAAATLRFHGVTDPEFKLDRRPGDEYQVAASPVYIYEIKREPVEKQMVHLDRPYYVWTIELSGPDTSGLIRFGAVGFTQTLRHDPIETGNAQELDPQQRPPFTPVQPPSS